MHGRKNIKRNLVVRGHEKSHNFYTQASDLTVFYSSPMSVLKQHKAVYFFQAVKLLISTFNGAVNR